MALMEYTVEQEIEDRLEAGRQSFILEGKKEGRIEVAKKLLKLNIPIETIVLASGLKMEEIQKLQKENED